MSKLNHHYVDRGVKKYMGFYLSEHTSKLEKDKIAKNNINYGLEVMSFQAISEVIEIALLKNRPILIQPNIVNIDGQGFSENIIGMIVGFNADLLYVGDICISLNLIRHISIFERSKWYNRKEG